MDFAKNKSAYIAVILLVLGIMFPSVSVTAHSPANMILEYDSDERKLSVTITHTVTDPTTHYIESVEIKVDGTVVETKTYANQPSTSSFTYEYDLSINDGSTVEVTAICNIAGSIKRMITVGDSSDDSLNGETTIPGYPIIGIIICISGIMLISLTKLKMRKGIK